MRNSVILLALSALIAAPLTAQSAPEYQAPAESEVRQLKSAQDDAMRRVRAGDAGKRAVLSNAERERIEAMLGGQIQDVQVLATLKAGKHFHVHWGVWVAIPSACGTAVLLVLLILLLL
jgi:hypothetical protein